MLLTMSVIVLILALLGSLPTWPHPRNWGYYPGGGISLVLFVLLIVFFIGREQSRPEHAHKTHGDFDSPSCFSFLGSLCVYSFNFFHNTGVFAAFTALHVLSTPYTKTEYGIAERSATGEGGERKTFK